MTNRDNTHRRARCLAADLGAGSGRVLAGEIADGRLELHEFHRFPTPRGREAGGRYLCWDLAAIEANLRRGLTDAAAEGPVASLGVDGWGVDYVLLDAQMQRIGPAVCYRDARTVGAMERVFARMAAERIYQRTGIQFQPFNTLYQLAATAVQEPGWLAAAHHLLMLPDWLHFRLSGVVACEYTNATTTQLLGLDGQWDEELLAVIGLERRLFVSPHPPGTPVGRMALPSGTAQVILPATHDTASAVAAAPLESADEAYLVSGTWSLMGMESPVPMATPAARALNVTNEGGVGGRWRVLKNIPGMWLLQQIRRELGATSEAELATAAASVPAWQALINPAEACFLDPPSMVEAIGARCRATGQPIPQSAAELARCVLDSLALSYAATKAGLEALRGRPLTAIRIIGGGCRNALLNQLCADACGVPVLAGPVETSAIGNICVQLIALGELADLEAARALVRRSFPIAVFQPRVDVPAAVRRRFRDLTTSPSLESAT